MKKIFLTALMALCSAFTFAQTEYEGFDVYGLDGGAAKQKKFSTALELNIGSDFAIGIRLQRNFNNYISWDMLTFKYGAGFKGTHEGDYDCQDFVYGEVDGVTNELSITTGLRAFTPSFGKKGKVRLYASLDCGYGFSSRNVTQKIYVSEYHYNNYYHYGYYDGYYTNETKKAKNNHFALDISGGVNLSKSLSLGYTAQLFLCGGYPYADHLLTLGYTF